MTGDTCLGEFKNPALWQGEGLEGQTWGKSLCLVQAKGITPRLGCSGHLTVVGQMVTAAMKLKDTYSLKEKL